MQNKIDINVYKIIENGEIIRKTTVYIYSSFSIPKM